MPLSPKDFIVLVHRWADANVNRIRTVWPLKGGWEAWAQGEIAGFINAEVGEVWMDREAYVYPDRSRADFLINDPFQNPTENLIVVEMKCESLHNWKHFVQDLKYDAWKLNGEMAMGLDAARKISLGLFFSPDSKEKLAMLHGYHIHHTHDREVGIASLII